jgi:dolichol kinase
MLAFSDTMVCIQHRSDSNSYRSRSIIPVEGIAWLLLAIRCWYNDRKNHVVIVSIMHLITRMLINMSKNMINTQNEKVQLDYPSIWRNLNSAISDEKSKFTFGDTMGMYMSIALIPIILESMVILLQQQQYHYTIVETNSHITYLNHVAMIVAIMQIFFWYKDAYILRYPQFWTKTKLMPYWIFLFLILATYASVFQNLAYSMELWFGFFWLCCIYLCGPYRHSSLQGIMTIGEWLVISCLFTFVWMSVFILILSDVQFFIINRYQTNNRYSTSTKDPSNTVTNNLYAFTAIAGLLGCIIACSTVNSTFQFTKTNEMIQRKFIHMSNYVSSTITNLLRIIYLGTVTLGIVECTFWYSNFAKQYTFPKCLWWIFDDFLSSVENSRHKVIWDHHFLSWFPTVTNLPRIVWLGYWFTTMLLTIPIAPTTGRISPVIARKWFHLIAILLFVPTTILVPELQSLSYAIAICVLLIIEAIRVDIPSLNEFYYTYLDTSKDEADDSKFVISHIALVAGCALPLWVIQYYNCLEEASSSYDFDVLVGLWGVWVLGIGDAMGAIVGKRYGRIKWGYNHRTVEGSIAMCLSLLFASTLSTWLVSLTSTTTPTLRMEHQFGLSTITPLIPAVLFVTLIEAYTIQIDNIVLPLAGTAMIFICRT